mgnify:CR=1 FL=1
MKENKCNICSIEISDDIYIFNINCKNKNTKQIFNILDMEICYSCRDNICLQNKSIYCKIKSIFDYD